MTQSQISLLTKAFSSVSPSLYFTSQAPGYLYNFYYFITWGLSDSSPELSAFPEGTLVCIITDLDEPVTRSVHSLSEFSVDSYEISKLAIDLSVDL